MARKLSVRQKKYLDKLMKADPNFKGFDLTEQQEDTLNSMNLFENLLGDVARYVGDKRLEQAYQ